MHRPLTLELSGLWSYAKGQKSLIKGRQAGKVGLLWYTLCRALRQMGKQLEDRAGTQFRAPWQGWFQAKLWDRQDLSQGETSVQRQLWQLTSPSPLSGIIWRGKEAWEILRVQYTVDQNTRVWRSLDFQIKEESQIEESAPGSGVTSQIWIWKSSAQC